MTNDRIEIAAFWMIFALVAVLLVQFGPEISDWVVRL